MKTLKKDSNKTTKYFEDRSERILFLKKGTKMKTMIAVKYFDNNKLTTKMFETMENAYSFALSVKYHSSFVADFVKNRIYKEYINKKDKTKILWGYVKDDFGSYQYAKNFIFNDLKRFK